LVARAANPLYAAGPAGAAGFRTATIFATTLSVNSITFPV
jgi:hypothetical protein